MRKGNNTTRRDGAPEILFCLLIMSDDNECTVWGVCLIKNGKKLVFPEVLKATCLFDFSLFFSISDTEVSFTETRISAEGCIKNMGDDFRGLYASFAR